MAAQTPPYVQQNGSHTAALFRQAFASLFGATQPGTLASTAGGVVNTTDLAVTAQASPNMTVNVAGGSCWIPQTQAANGGLYFGLNDATVVVAIAASNATNPRVDLICATVNDAAYSGSTNNWTIQAITGTPTAGATLTNRNGAGALPAASIPLAYVLVPAASTSVTTGNIADVRTFMLAGGGQKFSNNVDTGWVAVIGGVGLTNSWVTYNQAPYYRLQGNRVTLRGGIQAGTGGAAAFTLPVGYRPVVDTYFAANNGNGTFGSTQVIVGATGVVQPASSTYGVWLGGISFLID